MIVGRVKGLGDLARLSRASRLFQSLVEPLIYQFVGTFNPTRRWTLKMPQYKRLMKAVQLVPRLSNLVTEVDHVISSQQSCRMYGGRFMCYCEEHERIFGQMLSRLSALQTLHLCCWLPSHGTKHSPHSYLLAPTNQQLRAFNLRCNCCDRPDEYTSALVLTPLISSVTSLCIQLPTTHTQNFSPQVSPTLPQATENALRLALQNGDTLPQLKALAFDGRGVSNLILQHRPIERINIIPWLDPMTLCQAAMWSTIATSPGNPKAVFVSYALLWIPDIINCVEKFHYLAIIGIFEFLSGPDEDALQQIAPLSALPHLHTICVDRNRTRASEHLPYHDITPWFIHLLGEKLTTIDRVLVESQYRRDKDPGPVLWERKRCEEGWSPFQQRSSSVRYQDLASDRVILQPNSPQGACCHDIQISVPGGLDQGGNGG